MREEREDKDSMEALESYKALVQEVRMQRHELGNQLGVLSKSGSEEEKKYLEELAKDQRYGGLLLCGDPLLAGLLYQKCKKAEAAGIPVTFHFYAKIDSYAMQRHRLIGIAGVLLDNAIEAPSALQEADPEIRILTEERDGRLIFSVANRHPYIPYDELTSFFKAGKSSKGSGRGLGLAHAAKLCAQGGAEIGCGNEEDEKGNLVVFTLYLEKEDHKKTAEAEGVSVSESDEKSRGWILPAVFIALITAVIAAYIIFGKVLTAGGDIQERYALNEDEIYRLHDTAVREWNDIVPPDKGGEYEIKLSDIEEDTIQRTAFIDDSTVWLHTFFLEHYDDAGRLVRREHYVVDGYDTEEDKKRMNELGIILSGLHRTAFLRTIEMISYDDKGRIASETLFKKYAGDLLPEAVSQDIYLYEDNGYMIVSLDDKGVMNIACHDGSDNTVCEYETDETGSLISRKDVYPDAETDGRFLKDGKWYRGYFSETDETGRIFFDYDHMPVKDDEEKSSEVFFLDEECLQPVPVKENINIFHYRVHNEKGDPLYYFELDTESGEGHVDMLLYDSNGRRYSSYSYHVRFGAFNRFYLVSPDGGRLVFGDDYGEYYLYGRDGSRSKKERYCISRISAEDGKGNESWYFSFDKGRPLLYMNGEVSMDWTAPLEE